MFPVTENKQQYINISERHNVFETICVQMELFGMRKFRPSGEENIL
jgi:hypothetical protein